VYSLVSPSELAAALVRHPSAADVTDVLDRALRIDRTELARLSLAYRDDLRREEAWARVAACAELPEFADGARVGNAGGTANRTFPDADTPGPTGALVLADLLEFAREEILGWTREQHGDLVVQTEPGGTTALCDSLGAAWCGPELALADHARLCRPWDMVYGGMPAVAGPDDFGARSYAVRQLLDTLVSVPGDTLAQLAEAYRLQSPPRPSGVRPWDVAMRRACQSAFVTGTVREVAAAQFAAVRAQLLSGTPAGLPGTAAGQSVAYAVAGTVQAVAMRDTLDPVVHRFLVFAWETTLGAVPV
jgi:hypothetical protein